MNKNKNKFNRLLEGRVVNGKKPNGSNFTDDNIQSLVNSLNLKSGDKFSIKQYIKKLVKERKNKNNTSKRSIGKFKINSRAQIPIIQGVPQNIYKQPTRNINKQPIGKVAVPEGIGSLFGKKLNNSTVRNNTASEQILKKNNFLENSRPKYTKNNPPPPPTGPRPVKTPPPPTESLPERRNNNSSNSTEKINMGLYKKMRNIIKNNESVKHRMVFNGISEANITKFFSNLNNTSLKNSRTAPPPGPPPRRIPPPPPGRPPVKTNNNNSKHNNNKKSCTISG
jgi:hypothetical protein